MPSDLLGEFYAEQFKTGVPCPVEKALAVLSADDAAKLRAALAESRIQSSAINRWLNKHDITINQNSVSRHRRGDCRCPKT